MKFLPLYGMTLALGALIFVLLRVENQAQISRWLYAYLFVQFAASLVVTWGARSPEDVRTTAYQLVYALFLLLTFAAMLPLAWKL